MKSENIKKNPEELLKQDRNTVLMFDLPKDTLYPQMH